ncbi:MAG TPA: mechanosensitive ion channel domain-containing protein, partial [Candidatus Limnocylindrales bacterium]|nr:mechanosensitive ion channel domain-containing protein [Candidatus Limnocylindrales bacterium]
AQAATLGEAPANEQEMTRRVATIEDLLNKALRLTLVAGLVALVLGLFDLWSLLAGFGLVLAALTFAGQSIILDVIMGVLILMEGQYYKGDTVQINMIDGVVEEVGIRRTVIRDARGTLHSISNGLVRSSANFTRTYAAAILDIDGVADGDVEAVITMLGEIGADIAADEELATLLQDTPGYAGTTRFSSSGATLRLSCRVRPDGRVRVETEMRRRVAAGLAARGIELVRPGYRAKA